MIFFSNCLELCEILIAIGTLLHLHIDVEPGKRRSRRKERKLSFSAIIRLDRRIDLRLLVRSWRQFRGKGNS